MKKISLLLILISFSYQVIFATNHIVITTSDKSYSNQIFADYFENKGVEYENRYDGYGGVFLAELPLSVHLDVSLTLNNIKFSKNGACYSGGAIYNTYATTIVGSTSFISNYINFGNGGAIYNESGDITVTQTIFNLNKATLHPQSISSDGNGGAIYNESGYIKITSTTFSSNEASSCGGAIYNKNGLLVLRAASFTSNEAKQGGAIFNNGELAIHANNNQIESSFSSNKADSGGAIYNKNILTILEGTNFSYNVAISSGGAIYNSGILTIKADNYNDIVFTGNTANGISNAIHDSAGTINLKTFLKDIIFNDRITSENKTSILNVNAQQGKIVLNEDMSGYTGQVNLYGGEIELQSRTSENSIANTNKFFSGNINLSSGTLNILNSAIDNITVTNLTTTSNTNLKFDTDLSNNTSDNFTITNNATGELNITAINILGVNETSGQITLFQNINSSTNIPKININTDAIYGGYVYNFTNSQIAGVLSYERGGKADLKYAINKTIPAVRSYSLAEDETIENNLGTLGGVKLTIFGNSNNIEGNSFDGIYIANGKTLDIENVNNISSFSSSYGAIKNEGSLNIIGTNFSNNVGQDIINNGNLMLLGSSSTFEKGIVGIGTTTIKGININLNNAVIEQDRIVINNSGSLTTNASNITGNIENNSNLLFTGGSNNNYIFGNGKIIIDGEIINNSTISNNITINKNKQLTTNAINVTGDINNAGNYVLIGGVNMNWISGIGNTIIDGSVINNSEAKILNAVIINKNKKLSTIADSIVGNIENNGTLVFDVGTNNNIITGIGLTQIHSDVRNRADIIQNKFEILANGQLTNSTATIIVNELFTINNNAKIINDGKLIISSGTNNGIIAQWTNTSTTTICENFVNNGTIEQNKFNVEENGKVQNNNTITATEIINNGEIETSATNITGWIRNNGILLFNAGTENNNSISGSGILNITSNNITNNDNIEQKTVTISKDNINNLNFASSQLNTYQELNNFINNSKIKAENLNLSSVNLKLTEKGILSIENLYTQNSEIDFANLVLQEHNFKKITLSDNLNLYVDADLENKKMDTISAENFEGSGKINIKAINILSDATEDKTDILFTTSTILKGKITSTTTASSKLYKYDIVYNDGYFYFTNTNMHEINPVIAESAIASSVGGFATQVNVLRQAFTSIDTQISSRKQANKKGIYYASTSNHIFDIENKIERGLWIRPYAISETIKFNEIDVDNTAVGTLAGLDLATGENGLVSFYLGYAGSNQKYENIKVNQTGYIIGATGMIIKEKWYAGLTANINFNKAESQSDYGTDEFDMNMYSVGAKAGYNFDLSDKWTLEPNLMLMYGTVSNQEYETTQGAKVDSQSTANIIVEPQVKAKLSLDNGWQPYGLLGYVANISDKAKVVVDGTEFETDKIDGYVEYGAGVNKDFINTPWSCYLEATGRSGGRNGFAGNLGIKYKF